MICSGVFTCRCQTLTLSNGGCRLFPLFTHPGWCSQKWDTRQRLLCPLTHDILAILILRAHSGYLHGPGSSIFLSVTGSKPLSWLSSITLCCAHLLFFLFLLSVSRNGRCRPLLSLFTHPDLILYLAGFVAPSFSAGYPTTGQSFSQPVLELIHTIENVSPIFTPFFVSYFLQ